jgi:hypothetical protein
MDRGELNARLKEAIALAQAGQRLEARGLLSQIVEADPRQELAWMWLATVSTGREERIEYLERALALNPDNPTTRRAYEKLTGETYGSSRPSAPPPAVPASAAPPPPNVPRWLRALGQDAPISMTNFFILMVLAAAAVIVIMVVNTTRDSSPRKSTPRFVLPTALPSPTSRFSPTPSDTPRPTHTPGPSPTSVWNAPPPTWTTVPTATEAPSATPVPTATDTPTLTASPSPPPLTATFTALPATATRRPTFPPPRTPLPTATGTPDATATPDGS